MSSRCKTLRLIAIMSLLGFSTLAGPPTASRGDESEGKITHRFLATGGATYIRDGDGKITWRYPHSTRDGWVLSNGNVLLTVTKSKLYPGGAVVEVTREGETNFEFKGTQSEVNTTQKLENGNILLSEAGDKPRLLEVDRQGRIVVDVPLKAQTKDHHLQTRMTRKLANGNYLVPQLLDKVVREYTPRGEVVWEAKTPNMPFTAIRLDNGNTLIGCTHGNLVIEVDSKGKIVWQLTNDDLPGRPINDACGVQRLPNGNTVITSQHAQENEIKLMEVTPDKKLVWIHRDPETPSIRHFQILDSNGKALPAPPLRQVFRGSTGHPPGALHKVCTIMIKVTTLRTLTVIAGSAALAFGVLLAPLQGGGDGQSQPAAAADSKARQASKPHVAGGGKVYGEWIIVVRPDKGKEYNQLIETEGLPLFRAAGGRMVGWWTTAIGDLYEQVTIWEYDGLEAFEKAGQILGKNDRFAKFVAQRDPLLTGERSRFLQLADGAAAPTLPDRSKFVVHEVHRVPFQRMGAYLDFMRRQIPILKKHGFSPTGPWQTTVGRWNDVTYLFSFESLAERDRLIAAFSAHDDGKNFGEELTRNVDEVTTRILTPAPHSR